jgi:hypothetical protein
MHNINQNMNTIFNGKAIDGTSLLQSDLPPNHIKSTLRNANGECPLLEDQGRPSLTYRLDSTYTKLYPGNERLSKRSSKPFPYNGPYPTAPPLFSFSLSQEVAHKNMQILQRCNFDMPLALQSQSGSPLQFSSEFKPVAIIAPILQIYPLWKFTQAILTQGASFPLQELNIEDRIQDINFMIKRGNHKSALKNMEALSQLINDDNTRGFTLILPLDAIHHIKGISISPLGCQDQLTINECGEFITKND